MTPIRGRSRLVAAALAGLLAGSMLGAAPAAADPVALPAGPPPAGAPGHTTVLTLITGDQVTYTEDAAGRATATLLPGNDSATTAYRSLSTPDGHYVVPLSVEPYLQSGVLDRELFNVSYLAHNGYGDRESGSWPLIVSYPPQSSASAARTLSGAGVTHTLESLNGAAVSVAKTDGAGFWASLTATAKQATPGQAARISLDRKVRVSLSESVPLIGAPSAWQAGYDGSGVTVAVLDTGVDATHPDLTGRVLTSANFTPDASVADGHGHGTHVAATVGGSGAAAAGARKGVAPGAQLMIGKVLNNAGEGQQSWIIDGMEWAAAQGARIVSMSLGGGATDGTDPMAAAVDALSASTGTLFVIAAGNDGPNASTVSTPGTASSALTVGATSKTDQLANFSGRGPRLGDSAVKPEITGPGVGIVAARAAGTTMGTPVDQRYTSANGTSMATPHVAGAAALLIQRHPDWTAPRLKSALVASAKNTGFSVWQQGSGRVDVARAIGATVLAEPAVVNGGLVSDPFSGKTFTRDITYTNTGTTEVTLSLRGSLSVPTGQPAPAGMLSLDRDSLTVPAGGTATARLTVEPSLGPTGPFSGRVEASGPDGVVAAVPVGFVKGPLTHKVTIRIVLPRGASDPLAGYDLARVDDAPGQASGIEFNVPFRRIEDPDAVVIEASKWVPRGVYSVMGAVNWRDPRPGLHHLTYTPVPEVNVDKDTVLTFDAARATRVEVRAPQDTERASLNFAGIRTTRGGNIWRDGGGWLGPQGSLEIMPAAAPAIGTFAFTHEHLLTAPQIRVTLRGKGSTELRPLYVTPHPRVPKFAADTTLPLASEDDLKSGRDVRGKLVYVEADPGWSPSPELDLATAAGAAGVLAYSELNPTYLALPDQADHMKIPLLWLDSVQAAKVREVLAGAHRATAAIRSTLVTPVEYKLRYYIYDRIPDRLVYPVREHELTRIRTDYHGQFAGRPDLVDMSEANHVFRAGEVFSSAIGHGFDGPTSRTEYYTSTGPDVMWQREYTFYADQRTGTNWSRFASSQRGFDRRTDEHEVWNSAPVTVGQARIGPQFPRSRLTPYVYPCLACRQSDSMYLLPRTISSGDPTQVVQSPGTMEVRLTRDGTEFPLRIDGFGFPYYQLPADAGRYTMGLTYRDQFTGQQFAKTVRTEWTFDSAAPAANTVSPPYTCARTVLAGDTSPCTWQPLLYPSLDLPLDLHDTARAGKLFSFWVGVSEPASEPFSTALPPRNEAAGQPPPSLRGGGVRPAQESGAPRVAGLRLSVSYDDGKTWSRAVITGRAGDYQAYVFHPPLDRTTGAVSLKLESWDTAGNTVTQSIDRAYGLR